LGVLYEAKKNAFTRRLRLSVCDTVSATKPFVIFS
jgi:hypothetical protein